MNRLHEAARRVVRQLLQRQSKIIRRVASIEPLESRVLLLSAAPIWSEFHFHYLTDHTASIEFNMDVRPGEISNGLTNTDLTLEKVTTDTNVLASSIVLSNLAPGDHPIFSFTGITGSIRSDILTDGNYRASISRQEVADGGDEMRGENPGQTDAIEDFFVLSGDANHDGIVNLVDFNTLAANFGMSNRNFAQGDFSYDGIVNLFDFNIIAGHFGDTISAPPLGPDECTVDVQADGTLRVNWDPKSVTGHTGWRLQHSFDGQIFTSYGQLDPEVGTFVDDGDSNPNPGGPGLAQGTRIWYRIRAYSDPDTNPEGPNTAYTPKHAGNTRLGVPTITQVIPLSSSQLKILFTDNSQNETEFRVFRSPHGTNQWTWRGTVPSGQPTQFIDSGLAPNTQYDYYVSAHNDVTDSAPSNIQPGTTQPGTASVDLDLFEDANADFIHDNSSAAELAEGNQPTDLPYLEEDGDYQRLALIVNGAVPSATVTFEVESPIQLYQDVMGLYPITPGQAIPLSSLGLGSGSDTVVVFAKLTSLGGPEQTPGMMATLGGGSTGSTVALGGDVQRRITSDPSRPDNVAWHNGVHDNEGGLDDGDGPSFDPLTDRDGFWTTHAGKRTLIIGFAGHTQSAGTHGTNGRIWRVQNDPNFGVVGAYQIGNEIRVANSGWAVTMFPEDPGNDNSAVLARCGDGVLGRANPFYGDARVDADGNPTGALQFLIDSIVLHGIREVGLFGYSHGGGSLQLLMQALASRANANTALRDRLIGAGGPPIRFFWSSTIDAVNITWTVQGGQIIEAFGTPGAETQFPFGVIPQGPFTIGTEWHYNAYQLWTFWPFGDGVPLSGTELDSEDWPHPSSQLRQDYCEQPNWPRSTDHTNGRGRGIAEDNATTGISVRSRLLESLAEAYALLP